MVHPSSRRDAGYSLVECLVATGLLAGVLMSIAGLFAVGSNSVKSGRELTKATAIANAAMEQVLAWPFDKVYGFAGGVPTNETATWNTGLANPTYTGSAADVAEWGATADRWRQDVSDALQAGVMTYRVDGVARLPTNLDDGLDTYVNSTYLRVTITVRWREKGNRNREVVFEELVL